MALATVTSPNSKSVSLTHRAAGGMAWLLAQSIATKSFSFLAQLILAKLLMPKDFGQVGLAYTVSALAGLVANPGIDVVLIRRHAHGRRWITPCFWLGLVLGLAAGVLMAIAAPFGAHLYSEPAVTRLVLVLATAAPISALSIVPSALLSARMRFRELAQVGALSAVLISSCTIALAALGFGSLSFAIPVPFVAFVSSLILWSRVVERPSLGISIRRWRYLVGDSTMLFLSRASATVIGMADYAILGAMFTSQVVGPYFFGFNFSVQAVRLLAGNVSSVVLPTLTAISNDPRRQVEAAIRASRVLAMIGIPLCLLQAAGVAPLFRLLFAEKWNDAVPVVQLLSIGLAFDLPAWVGVPLANAQGRYKLVAGLFLLWIPIFAILVYIGAYFGGSTGAAAGVAAYYILCSQAGLFIVAHRGARLGWKALIGTFPPLVLSALATAFGLAGIAVARMFTSYALVELLVLGGISLIAYHEMCRFFTPSRYAEVRATLEPLFGRLRRASVSPAG